MTPYRVTITHGNKFLSVVVPSTNATAAISTVIKSHKLVDVKTMSAAKLES